jgi:hypothetical protein
MQFLNGHHGLNVVSRQQDFSLYKRDRSRTAFLGIFSSFRAARNFFLYEGNGLIASFPKEKVAIEPQRLENELSIKRGDNP